MFVIFPVSLAFHLILRTFDDIRMAKSVWKEKEKNVITNWLVS
jgi:hypothetical protein